MSSHQQNRFIHAAALTVESFNFDWCAFSLRGGQLYGIHVLCVSVFVEVTGQTTRQGETHLISLRSDMS